MPTEVDSSHGAVSDGNKLEGETDAQLEFIGDQLLPEQVPWSHSERAGRRRLRRIERTIQLREIPPAKSGTDIGDQRRPSH